MTLLTSPTHETKHESWLENLTPPHGPRCPEKQKGWFLGFLFLAVKPPPPCRTVTTDPQLEHQGAHNQAGRGFLLTSLLPMQQGSGCLLQSSPYGGDGKNNEAEQTQRKLSCAQTAPVISSGPARILPSQTGAYLLPVLVRLF